jgi:hypothetical protein
VDAARNPALRPRFINAPGGRPQWARRRAFREGHRLARRKRQGSFLLLRRQIERGFPRPPGGAKRRYCAQRSRPRFCNRPPGGAAAGGALLTKALPHLLRGRTFARRYGLFVRRRSFFKLPNPCPAHGAPWGSAKRPIVLRDRARTSRGAALLQRVPGRRSGRRAFLTKVIPRKARRMAEISRFKGKSPSPSFEGKGFCAKI